MNRFLVLIALLSLPFFAKPQSQQNTKGIDRQEYMRSKEAFEAAKQKHGNSYEFSLYFASFTGYWSKTTMKVENGVVTERRFESGDLRKNKETASSWKETGKNVGSTGRGAAPITIDQIYAEGEKWLAPEQEQEPNPLAMPNSYYFSTDEQGIVSMLGMVPGGCADDCFRGYKIRDFKWLK